MLKFKVFEGKVMFFSGNHVLGMIDVKTYKHANINRVVLLANKLRDFGSLEERQTVIRIAYDYLMEHNLI